MMSVSTEKLFVLMAIERGWADNRTLVDWAVAQLAAGLDTPNLRILAGLDSDSLSREIEMCFKEVCEDLGLNPPGHDRPNVRELNLQIKHLWEKGEIDAKEALELLHHAPNHHANWSGALSAIENRLAGLEPYQYSLDESDTYQTVLEREWDLYEREIKLTLPVSFPMMYLCTACGHFGELSFKGVEQEASDAEIEGHCPRCNSSENQMRSSRRPDVREEIFDRIEKGGKDSVFGPTS